MAFRCRILCLFAVLAALCGGCFDLELESGSSYSIAYATDDPMDPAVVEKAPISQKHGIYYEFPSWLDYSCRDESWEAGYAWVSLAFLSLHHKVGFDEKATKDLVRFRDLVEGVEVQTIVNVRVVGRDKNQKTVWSDQFELDRRLSGKFYMRGVEKAYIPYDLSGLAAQRAKSPFHIPFEVSLGDRKAWAIGDRLWFMGQYLDTVELYPNDPRKNAGGAFVIPSAVWILARCVDGKWYVRDASVPYLFEDRAYVVTRHERRDDGGLVAFEAKPWKIPSFDELIDGVDSEAFFPFRWSWIANPEPGERYADFRVRLEEAINYKLIEWKAEGMPKLLAGMKHEEATKLAVRLEKALLKIDLKIRQFKDAVDEDARSDPKAKKAPARALDRAHLLDQRKAILSVILAAVKRVAAGGQ